MKAALDGLDAVKGDLSNGQAKYREALQKTEAQDARPATSSSTRTARRSAPPSSPKWRRRRRLFYNKVVKTVPNVNQTLGLPKAEFEKMGLGSRDVPDCP